MVRGRAEEQQIGAGVSEKIRQRYGVVQDANVHRYVALVGTVLAQASSRPSIPWTFVVLDTDGVNAFAAPGGFVHITRGALALLQNEAELAGVLAHEIIHVSEKHTIRAIQKNKTIEMGANETLSGNAALLNRVVDNVYQDPSPTNRHNLKTGANIPSDILAEVDRKVDDGLATAGQLRFSAFGGASNGGQECFNTTTGAWQSATPNSNCGAATLF